MARFDEDEDEPKETCAYSEWHLWKQWKQYRVAPDGRRIAYDYAGPLSQFDDEDQAFRGMAEALIGLRQNDEVATVELTRWDYRQTGRKKSKEGQVVVAVMETTALDGGLSGSGILPLAVRLKRERRDQWRAFTEPERQTGRQRMAELRAELERATVAMRSRQVLLGKPMTPAEHAEAKAGGWDQFGEAPRPTNDHTPEEPDTCHGCLADATSYTPDGRPACDLHREG